jgi:hypothetical protein
MNLKHKLAYYVICMVILLIVLTALLCRPSKAHCAVCESPHYHVYIPYAGNDDCGPARYCTPEPPEPCPYPYPSAEWCNR